MKLARESSEVQDFGPVAFTEQRGDGYTINFVKFRENIDHAPLFKGLPDERCQCPHWGYVLKGKVTLIYADREEAYEEGDAFYAPPGHVPVHEAGTEYVQFSPTDELDKTTEAIMKNMQEMQRD